MGGDRGSLWTTRVATCLVLASVCPARPTRGGLGRDAMTRRTRTGLAALGAAALVVLAGCQSGDNPPDTPTPSPTTSTASPSPSPTVTPSPSPSSSIPAAAQAKTEAGAKAFARFYVEQSALAWTTPDASLIEGLATARCATCDSLASTARDLEAKGHRYNTTPVKVAALTKFRGGGEEWVFDADLREQAVKVVDASGKVISESPAKRLKPAIAVIWREGRWWLDAIGD